MMAPLSFINENMSAPPHSSTAPLSREGEGKKMFISTAVAEEVMGGWLLRFACEAAQEQKCQHKYLYAHCGLWSPANSRSEVSMGVFVFSPMATQQSMFNGQLKCKAALWGEGELNLPRCKGTWRQACVSATTELHSRRTN